MDAEEAADVVGSFIPSATNLLSKSTAPTEEEAVAFSLRSTSNSALQFRAFFSFEMKRSFALRPFDVCRLLSAREEGMHDQRRSGADLAES